MEIKFNEVETPKTKEELIKLIKIAILSKGPDCDLNFIDVSNITDMSELFKDSNFSGDISKWDVSKVENMEGIFTNCPKGSYSTTNWNISDRLRLQIDLSVDLKYRLSHIYVTKVPYEYIFLDRPYRDHTYQWEYDLSRIKLPLGTESHIVKLDIYRFNDLHFRRFLHQLVTDSPLSSKIKRDIGVMDMGDVISYVIYKQFYKYRGIGKKTVKEIEDYLKSNGILLD